MSIDRVDTSKCAICGVQRQEANHWFLVRVAGAWKNADSVVRANFASRGLLEVTEYRAELAKVEDWRACCGEGDLMKLVSRWIATGSLADPRSPAADVARKEV